MATKPTILIVDDDPGLRKTLTDILKARGYAPAACATGKAAMESLEAAAPAVALIDIRLKDMPGLEVLKGIKARSPDTKCILLTGYASQESAVEAINLGAYSYLQKPYDMEQLLLIIQRAVEKREAEIALRQAAEEWQRTFDTMSDMVAILDKDFRIVRANQATASLFGRQPQELIGQKCYHVVHGLDCPIADCPYRRTQQSGQVETVEVWEPTIGKWLLVTTNPLRDASGNMVGTVHVMRDITARKQAEDELRQRNEDLALINAMNDALNRGATLQEIIQLLAQENRRIFASHGTTLYLLSEDKKHLVMQNLTIPPSVAKRIEKLIGTGIPPIQLSLKAGSRSWELLQAGEPRLIDDPEAIQQWMLEFTQTPYLPAMLRPAIRKLIPRIYKALGIRSVITAPLVLEGEAIGLLDMSGPEPFSATDLKRIEVIAGQLTAVIKRKQDEEALANERNLLRTLIDNLPDYVFVKDAECRFITTNTAHLQILGAQTVEEVVGKTDFDFSPRELAGQYYADEQAIVQSGRPVLNREEPAVDPQGSRRWLLTTKVPLRDSRGAVTGLVGISRDITERKQAEDEIRRRAAHQEALNAIIAAATAATDLQALLETALSHALQALELEIGAIWIAGQHTVHGLPPETGPAIAQAVQATSLKTTHLPELIAVTDWQQSRHNRWWPALYQAMLQAGIRASLTVPIALDGQHIGGLSLAAPRPRSWSAQEIALMEAVGRQLAAAAERLRLLEEARTHARQMRLLAAVSETLTRPLDAAGLATVIGQGTLALSDADRAALYVRQPGDTAACTWFHGLSPAYVAQAAQQARALPGGRLLDDARQPVLIADVTRLSEDSLQWKLAQAEGYRALALWPLAYEGRAIAAVGCYYDRPHTWSEADQEVMQAFARQAAVALENARLFTSLQASNRDLQAALQAKDQMIQNVSHELRTPLTIIIGFGQMLTEGTFGRLTAEQAEALAAISSQSERLRTMVERLLTLQMLDKKALEKTSMSPALLLGHVEQTWRHQATQAGIELRLEVAPELPTIMADVAFMNQLMDNLIDNAIKFSPDGGVVEISAWQGEDELVMAVSDQGIGIPPGRLEQVFDRFYQVEGGTTRRFGGMGIGLALCRAIVTAHDGRIWAESAGEGQGSTFYVALPTTRGSSRSSDGF